MRKQGALAGLVFAVFTFGCVQEEPLGVKEVKPDPPAISTAAPESTTTSGAVAPAASPESTAAPSLPAVPTTDAAPATVSSPAGEAAAVCAEPNPRKPPGTTPGAPALKPRLLVATLVGGAGNQYLREVGFDSSGGVFAKGKGFTLRYDASFRTGTVEGDKAMDDAGGWDARPPLPGQDTAKGAFRLVDPRRKATYYIGYRQVITGLLQQPLFRSSEGWSLWNWDGKAPMDKSLGADSRGYDLWLMPNGLIGAQLYCDGGNSTLKKDPCDLDTDNPSFAGAWQKAPDGVGSLFVVIDPEKRRTVSGTFIYSQASRHAQDAFGRVYIPRSVTKRFPTVTPANPFNMKTGGAGLFVLSSDLAAPEFSAYLSGDCQGGKQELSPIAVRGNIAVLGGTSCAESLPNAPAGGVQAKNGGGQDGYLVVLELWNTAVTTSIRRH